MKALNNKHEITTYTALVFLFLLTTAIGDSANAQLMIYPAQGQSQEQQQQEAATQQAQVGSYNKARGVCLEGRGYTVKQYILFI